MQASRVLRQFAVRITLFTRENCSLCTDARQVLSNVWDKRPFEYDEFNVMEPGNERWKIYEFDTPVVHVDKTKEGNSEFKTTTEALKLMHRFKEAEIEKLMDQAMQTAAT